MARSRPPKPVPVFETLPPDLATVPTFGLGDVLQTLSAVVQDLFGAPVWVRCEVVSAQSKSKGYWVLQVQDTEGGLGARPSAQVFVWNHQVPLVIGRFRRETGQDLAVGMQIRLLVEPSFSAQWGFRLIAHGIDPSWTVGASQQETERIRSVLRAEGVWERNRRLPPPADFTRVLLIAPDGSAGLGDMMREATALARSGVCAFDVANAPFEGPNAVPQLTAMLLEPFEAGVYDAVCIVRGGGASAGIATLNHESLVRAVCLCPLPVIVGIGHERDSTLLDEVAHTSLHTPSKVIGHLLGTVVANAQAAQKSWERIASGVAARLDEASGRATERMNEARLRADALLARAEEQSDALVREAVGLGPESTLRRGYAWVRGSAGPLTTAAAARAEAALTLHFQDGAVPVRPETFP